MCLASKGRVLIVTSVSAERDAILLGLQENPNFQVLVGGVGSSMIAANTAKALASGDYGLVINAGIAGGFAGKAEVGSLALANEIIAADLGVETPEGFSSLDELGLGSTRLKTNIDIVIKLAERFMAANLTTAIGPIITVTTVTGTSEGAAKLTERVPGAIAEAMEGYGAALAAHAYGLPILELRAISNLVGPRERSAWRIKEALEVLQEACFILSEVFI